jgi:hypothetical protein
MLLYRTLKAAPRPNPQAATNDHKNIRAEIFLDRENRSIATLDMVKIERLINRKIIF